MNVKSLFNKCCVALWEPCKSKLWWTDRIAGVMKMGTLKQRSISRVTFTMQ